MKSLFFDLGAKSDSPAPRRDPVDCPVGHRFGSDPACPELKCRAEYARKQAIRLGSPYTRPMVH